jgi:hypothetical protein
MKTTKHTPSMQKNKQKTNKKTPRKLLFPIFTKTQNRFFPTPFL